MQNNVELQRVRVSNVGHNALVDALIRIMTQISIFAQELQPIWKLASPQINFNCRKNDKIACDLLILYVKYLPITVDRSISYGYF